MSNYKFVNYFTNETNLGFLKTCNKVFANIKESYEYIFIHNSDVIVNPCTYKSGIELFAKDENIALISYLATEGAQLSIRLPECVSFKDLHEYLQKYNLNATIPAVTTVGHLMGIRTKVIEGDLFDPIYEKGYGEETDLHYRLLKRGYKACVVPNAFVYHRGEASFGANCPKPHTKIFYERWGVEHNKAVEKEATENSLGWLRDPITLEIKQEHLAELENIAYHKILDTHVGTILIDELDYSEMFDEICWNIFKLQNLYQDILVIKNEKYVMPKQLPAKVLSIEYIKKK